ncbi:MAG: site-specific DNA-methyltransferase [Melioribacteraceae bacterium]
MGTTLARNKDLPMFFGHLQLKGEKLNVDIRKDEDKPVIFYKHPNGALYKGNSIEWLKSLKNESVDLIFADPPYNIKKADWDSFENQEEYIKWSMLWIEQASRILKPSGTLYVCGFSEILADLKHPASKYFKSCRWIIWHYKNKANLGNDWGRSHESILHLRKSKEFKLNIDDIRIPYSEHTLKYPSHPQAETSQYNNGNNEDHIWEPNPLGAKPKDVLEIPTTCNGMHEKTPHPTQKPEELLRKIILASSNVGDIVLDPFCGSGTTPVCSEQLQRKWLACDLSQEYLEWAVNRVETVEDWSIEKWLKYDFENLKRRSSIR